MTAIDDLARRYAAAVHAKDVAAFLSIYDEQVTVFDMWDEWVYEGRAAWGQAVRGWLGSLGDERVGVSFAPISTVAGSDWAVWCATVRYAGLDADSRELRSMENRMSWTLRRTDGLWAIVQEHSSAPASFETTTVRLSRSR